LLSIAASTNHDGMNGPNRLASFSWLRVRSILILCYKRSHRFEEKPAPPVLMANAAYQKNDVAPCGRQVGRSRMRQGLLICYKQESTEEFGTNSTDLGEHLILLSVLLSLRFAAAGRSRVERQKKNPALGGVHLFLSPPSPHLSETYSNR